jgi:hypothetical protein
MTDPTPLPAAPDWRALCKELRDAYQRSTDEQLLELAAAAIDGYDSIAPGEFEPEAGIAVEAYGSELIAFARAVLARWGGAAVQPNAAPTEEDLYDLAEEFNGDPVPAIRRALELWGGAAVQPVPVSERLPGARDLDAANRCWWFAESHEGRETAPTWAYGWRSDDDTHWVPWWAPPAPAAAEGEGQP